MNSFLREHRLVEGLFAEGLKAVEPRTAVAAALAIDHKELRVDGHEIGLNGKVIVLAIGKAAAAMARGCVDVLKDRIDRGIILTKDGHLTEEVPGFEAFEARHPLPDQRGIDATRVILNAVRKLDPDDVVIALISGGGSALLEAPVNGVSLEAFQQSTDLLLKAGAPIQHLNAVRSTISQVKGGGLRRAIGTATCVSLILSDVLGNDPSVIASGPTVSGDADFDKAKKLIRHYGIESSVPESVIRHLATNPTTESGGDANDADVWHIVGDNSMLLERVSEAAELKGLRAEIVWRDREGEARELGIEFARLVADPNPDVDVLIGGGEATVTVQGNGIGGRNTEFALAAAIALDRAGTRNWVIASLGSDGQDGSSDAAGAIADPETSERARAQGLDAEAHLQNNDSASLFSTTGGLVTPGPTGTNVNDLYLAIRAD